MKKPLVSNKTTSSGLIETINLLIVDDEVEISEIMKVFLEDLPINVFTATTLAEARIILEREKENLTWIFCDYHLKEENGLSLINELPLPLYHYAIYIMTGSPDQQILRDALNLGVQAVFYKPFHLEVLQEIYQDRLQALQSIKDTKVKRLYQRYNAKFEFELYAGENMTLQGKYISDNVSYHGVFLEGDFSQLIDRYGHQFSAKLILLRNSLCRSNLNFQGEFKWIRLQHSNGIVPGAAFELKTQNTHDEIHWSKLINSLATSSAKL